MLILLPAIALLPVFATGLLMHQHGDSALHVHPLGHWNESLEPAHHADLHARESSAIGLHAEITAGVVEPDSGVHVVVAIPTPLTFWSDGGQQALRLSLCDWLGGQPDTLIISADAASGHRRSFPPLRHHCAHVQALLRSSHALLL